MLPVVAKQFHKLREVRVQSEAVRNSRLVGVVAVGCDLHTIRDSFVQIGCECMRVGRGALADVKGRNEFAFGVDHYEYPLVAAFSRVILANIAGLLLHEAPYFIDLQMPRT